MSRSELWRLDRAGYPFTAVAQTRFGDLDVLGHINNVAMASLFENGRVRFNRSLNFAHIPGERWLIANVTIDYLAEAHFPHDVIIASGIGRIGRTSWTIASAAFQADMCVALCDTVVVYTEGQQALPIPEEFKAAFEAHRVPASR